MFAVNINVHRKLVAGTKSVLLGQNVFALTSLQPGEQCLHLENFIFMIQAIYYEVMCACVTCRYTIHPSTYTWRKINISCWTIC